MQLWLSKACLIFAAWSLCQKPHSHGMHKPLLLPKIAYSSRLLLCVLPSSCKSPFEMRLFEMFSRHIYYSLFPFRLQFSYRFINATITHLVSPFLVNFPSALPFPQFSGPLPESHCLLNAALKWLWVSQFCLFVCFSFVF